MVDRGEQHFAELSGVEPHWSETIRAWADTEPLVLEVYAFGSRVKGGYTPESDLDLAVLVDGADEGERLGNAIGLVEHWSRTFYGLLPVVVDLDCMMPDDIVVTPAVREHGLKIYP